MSFFEIEPMGARHYGGIGVGGMPMGGMSVGGMTHQRHYGGMYDAMGGARTKKGEEGYVYTPLSKDQKEHNKLIRAETQAKVDYLADEIQKQFGVSVSEALKRAKSTVNALNKKARMEGVVRARVQRPKKGEEGYVPAKKHDNVWYATHKDSISTIKKRLNTGKNGSLFTQKRITQKDLAELSAWLESKGYGIEDLEGCAWYDDLWSGVKDVAKFAMPLVGQLLH
jgi:hypothetical protein